MKEIKFEQVFKSYNGRTGCMCGCMGKYSLPSHTPIEEGNKVVGWEAYDESNVNDRSVKIAVKKINQAIVDKDEHLIVDDNGEWISIDDGNRNTTVYLKK